MNESEYRAHPALNVSYLKGFAKSPAHALVPKVETPAMALGTAFHCRVLEPERFPLAYAVAPKCDRRTTVGKAIFADFEIKNAGKILLTEADAEALNRMAEAVNKNSEARDALSCGKVETPIFWELDGIPCKGRPDVYGEDIDLIVDLKKTVCAEPYAFRKQIETLLYHWQGAFYLDGHKARTGRDGRFCFVCVEPTPPYGVSTINLHPGHVELGRQGYRKAIQLHLECTKTGIFPGYPEGWIELPPSKWAGDGFQTYEMEDDFNDD